MLSVVIAAATAPNFGAASAQTSTPYSVPSSAPSGLSAYDWLAIAAVLVVVALLAALLILRRRRRQPPTTGPPPVQPWPGGGPPPGAGGQAPPAPPTAAPAYLETPEDVGHGLPEVPVAGAAAGGAAAGAAAGGGAAAAEGEPDIDSLMAELDKISSEILKRAPKKPSEPPSEGTSGDQTQH